MFKLLNKIITFYFQARRRTVFEKFNRRVSAGDLIFDRWETARFFGFGEGTSVYDSVLIIGDVTVGKNCWVGPNVILDGSGGLTIGDGCTISAGVHIYTHNNISQTVSGGVDPAIKQKSIIGNNVYIGPNSILSGGLKIGDRVTIGALTYVDKNLTAGQKYHSGLKNVT